MYCNDTWCICVVCVCVHGSFPSVRSVSLSNDDDHGSSCVILKTCVIVKR